MLFKEFTNEDINKLNTILKTYHGIFKKTLYTKSDIEQILNINELKSFFTTLLNSPNLSLFYKELELVAGGIHCSLHEMPLVNWIIHYSFEYSLNSSLETLSTFLKLKKINTYKLGILNGIIVESTIDLTDDIKILNINELNNKFLRNQLESFNILTSPFPPISSVIQQKVEATIYFVKNGDLINFKNWVHTGYDDIVDACIILSFLSNKGNINILALEDFPEDSMPIYYGNYSFSRLAVKSINKFDVSSKELNLDQFNALYSNYINHPSKTEIRIILKYFNDSKNPISSAQRFIDIRTCLEAIFLTDDENNELRYRLSLRAAIYEHDILKKNVIRKDIKKLYDYASIAIHSGDLDKEIIIQANKLYEKTYPFIRSIIDYIIRNKSIDWPASELKGEIVSKV